MNYSNILLKFINIKHKNLVKKCVRIVTLQQSAIIVSKNYDVKSRQKLCASCRIRIFNQEDSELSDRHEENKVSIFQSHSQSQWNQMEVSKNSILHLPK